MILITAATGQVGRAALKALVGAGSEVRALVRDPSPFEAPEGVQVLGRPPPFPLSSPSIADSWIARYASLRARNCVSDCGIPFFTGFYASDARG